MYRHLAVLGACVLAAGSFASLRAQEAPPTETVTQVAYNVETDYVVFVLNSYNYPDADVHFSYTPGGAVVPKTQVAAFVRQFAGLPTVTLVCSFPEGVPKDFWIDHKASRDRFCTPWNSAAGP